MFPSYFLDYFLSSLHFEIIFTIKFRLCNKTKKKKERKKQTALPGRLRSPIYDNIYIHLHTIRIYFHNVYIKYILQTLPFGLLLQRFRRKQKNFLVKNRVLLRAVCRTSIAIRMNYMTRGARSHPRRRWPIYCACRWDKKWFNV